MQREHVTVVIVDIVESVLLMQHDFEGVVARWQALVQRLRAETLPRHGGRLVKSLGDGVLLTFDRADQALAAAFEIQALVPPLNEGLPAERVMALRIGVHDTDVVVDELDIYGPGVNLAARLLTLARPGQTIVSDAARDAVADPFLASFTDLGPCYLKHIEQPVRAFTARPAIERDVVVPVPQRAGDSMRPTLAVLTFAVDSSDAEQRSWGTLLADELTRMLSQQSICGVVSRLSAHALPVDASAIEAHARRLGATYVVFGACRPVARGAAVNSTLWLRDTGSVLEHAFELSFDELRDVDSEQINRWVGALSGAVVGVEMRRANGLPLPALADFTLLFAGVSMMHKTSGALVQRAGETLDQLVERHPRVAEPRAWMAKWHVLRMANGLATDGPAEARLALAQLRRALDEQPNHALASTIEGLVHLFLQSDLAAATRCYQRALAADRNESLAWLFLSSVHAHAGDGAQAMACIAQARTLSPVDPLTHYFDGFTAWSLLAAERWAEAATFAQRAMAANVSHRPTYFTLAMAQQLAGDTVAAHRTGQAVLALVPNFTVTHYLKAFPGGVNAHAQRLAQALRDAGLPP